MNPVTNSTSTIGASPAVVRVAEAPPRPELPGGAEPPSFARMLSTAVQSTSNAEWKAQELMAQSAMGKELSEVEMMTSIKKADLSLRMMLQIRNSLLQAYDEIKSMQF